jgi:hypothetical protein
MNLRPIEKSDLNIIQTWRNNDKVTPFVREYRGLSIQHIDAWYESMILDDKFEMFIMENDKELIGICGLTYINWQNRHADLHFAIYKDFEWIDDTYALKFYEIITDYAFNQLNLNKIYVEIYGNDDKKLKFFKSLNFKVDAQLREHYFYNGEYITSYILSLLKGEYNEKYK